MKAAIYPGEGKPVILRDLPDPEPGPDELLVRIHRCGICGTDLSMTKGEAFDFGKDRQFGHEYSGEVIGMGSNVSGFRLGDKISALPSGACHQCHACSTGNNVLCRNVPSRMTGFAELITLPTDIVVKLPDTLSFADGALIEPLAVSLYGLNHSGLKAGDDVLVLGGGTVALYAIYWARRMGARRIVAMSRSQRRRDLCLAMGADAFVTFGEDEAKEVSDAMEGRAPVIVFECVGASNMLERAIAHAGLFGKVVSLGFCTGPDPIIPAKASYKCVSMQFLVGYTMREFFYIAEQMDKGHVDPKTIITSEVPLSALPETMQALRGPNNETKVHVRMTI